MNQWTGIGRLTRDPEIRTSQNNTMIARFSLAVDRRWSKEKETDFFNVTAFGKLAEFSDKYLKQGIKVAVIAEVHNDNYTNKEGQKVYAVNFVASSIEFCESKNSGGNTDKPQESSDQWMNIPDGIQEELPFN